MKGTLKLEFSEALHNGEKCTATTAKCNLMNVSFVDKITIVHTVLDMLKFSEKETMALGLACATDYWPNKSIEKQVIRDEVIRGDRK